MFRKLLIANRGEIAVRIIHACRELGIRPVVVYSDADRSALHVRLADEAWRVGPAAAAESYLDQEALIAAARAAGAEAVHPGYGFLSENADFAGRCRAAGLVFVGPPTEAIRAMGDKAGARKLARSLSIPVVDGYDGADQLDARLAAEARRIGYPVLIKAAMGGGGKGMHAASDEGALLPALAQARREARSAFGDDRLILERLLIRPRHVEVQVLGDEYGALAALGERDCSTQRRRQKVIEESPSPAVDAELRQRLCELALRLAEAVGYRNAGTVEFLLGQDGAPCFLEMNTRLQVEHAVTEAVYGVDLVRAQIEIAAGERMRLPSILEPRGHAIECRLYAEDPRSGFLPSTGRILAWRLPAGSGVRNDPGVAWGDDVSPYYDPLLAKLTVWAPDRAAAVARMQRALADSSVLGVRTNLQLLRMAVESDEFRRGDVDIAFLERELPRLLSDLPPPAAAFCAASVHLLSGPTEERLGGDPWRRDGPWRLAGQDVRLRWEYGGSLTEVRAARRAAETGGWCVEAGDEGYVAERGDARAGVVLLRAGARVERFDVAADGAQTWVGREGDAWTFAPAREQARRAGQPAGAAERGQGVNAPMPGIVVKLLVVEGERVAAHQPLLALEAMKMEHTIEAPTSSVVRRIFCREGDLVSAGARLVDLAE